MNKRTRCLAITRKVKEIVYERDGGCCIICGRRGLPNSHYIRRSKGGLGIPENIVTMCFECHYAFDFTSERKSMLAKVRTYLRKHYPDFHDEGRVYRK